MGDEEGGECLITFTQEKNPEVYDGLIALADIWGLKPESKAFGYRIGVLVVKKAEEIRTCDHLWSADSCGMMVSRYSCKKCKIEKMVSDPPC